MDEERKEVCLKIKAELDTLSTAEVEELFKILHSNNTYYSRNNNGVFINLAWLSDDVLLKIKQYIEFCGESRKEINKYETMRKNFNIDVTLSETDEIIPENGEDIIKEEEEEEKDDQKEIKKTNTNTKFYLMKKKFQKCQNLTNKLIDDLLTYDTPQLSKT